MQSVISGKQFGKATLTCRAPAGTRRCPTW